MKKFSLLFKELLGEFLGVLALIQVGGFLVLNSEVHGVKLVSVALAHGLVLGIFVFYVGNFGGAHFNPAVTLAMLITGNQNIVEGILYIISQCLGSICGAGILKLMKTSNFGAAASDLGYPSLASGVS